MMWVTLVLLGLLAIPVTTELTRSGMTDAVRTKAPGQFALLSQGTTHFEWLGPERGPIAVCIHGLTTPSFVWYGMAKGLALMGFRVLVYDLYGRGYSDRTRGKQDADFFNQQLTDLLAHENVGNHLTVLGYSMGGAIAAHFTACHPQRVKQLILLAPAGMFELGGRKITLARDLPVIGDWLFLAAYPWEVRRGIASEAHLPTSVEGIHDLQQEETGRRGYFPAVLSSLRGLLRKPCEDQHRVIAAAGIPVLAVWGDQDDVIPLTCKDTLSDWNSAAQQAMIHGAGHGLPHTHTEAVLDAIRSSRG
ncbi:alpha/beta fold hydrolase [uncultured Tateyamaria sp.]|uniref:alpha/beta fold hydrolase n=1 Tax=uncultured Tateyamaria sp. TaxID=455651 RepID=UPI00260FA181|nr:alpha/beta hydrolase [uncultured Tateyamaria sp.]